MIPSNLDLMPAGDLNALVLDTVKRLQTEALAAAKEASSARTDLERARHLKQVIADKCALANKLRKGSRKHRINLLARIGCES